MCESKIKKTFFFSLIICLLFISLVHAEEVGKITALQGKVDILRAGKLPAVPAKINEPVYLNDIIRTKTDSRAEIVFRDGTVVKIAPRSRVDISEYFTDGESLRVTINVPRGKVGAAVAEKSIEKIKGSPKANRFEIKTPIAVAG
ncbi:FecR family protein, partial [Thermodesulfovibrio sp.]